MTVVNGQIGFCKVCSSDLKGEVNKRLNRGDTIVSVERYLESKEYPVSQPTIRKHREHITSPKTTFVEKARQNPAIKRGVTTNDFLQTLVEIGATRAAEEPDLVSLDQSIRAAQIIEGRKDKQVDALVTIARMLMGQAPRPEIIEGEYFEVKEITTSDGELPSDS